MKSLTFAWNIFYVSLKVICADTQQSRLDQATRAGADDAVLWNIGASVDEVSNIYRKSCKIENSVLN